MQVLEKHKDKFTTDFAQNKKTLDQLTIVRSKGLKNEMAGYITKHIKRETDAKAAKENEIDEESEELQPGVEEIEASEQEMTGDTEPQEIIVENSQES
jgi:small subunit ribosomal protein S17e